MASTATINNVRSASIVVMDTIVTVKVISDQPAGEIDSALEQALGWFGHVERICSRFDSDSEVFRLAQSAQRPTRVSPLLFEAINFSVEVAAASNGAFDPTVGARQAERGFDVDYVSQAQVATPTCDPGATYRDIALNAEQRTVSLRKPLLIDLGAVAKGLAIDLAAKELARFESFSIDAGGDLYVKGSNEQGEPWRIGIEHPRANGLIAIVHVDEGAICTSGDYARPSTAGASEHHLLDPHSDSSPREVISATVVAPTAMAADALSTAAFVSGVGAGLGLLADQSLDGMMVDRDLTVQCTPGFERWLA